MTDQQVPSFEADIDGTDPVCECLRCQTGQGPTLTTKTAPIPPDHTPDGLNHGITGPGIIEPLRTLALPIDSLDEWGDNPRQGNDQSVKRSIEAFGFLAPVIYRVEDDTKVVFAGNTRLRAARDLGWTHLAAVDAAHLSIDQIRAFALADNRTSELGTFNEAQLADIILSVQQASADLIAAAGWDGDDIDALLDRITTEPDNRVSGDQDDIPEPPPTPVTRLGDIWQLGDHRLACGDSTDPTTLADLMGGEQAICVHADPPYGMNKDIANDNLHGPNLDAFQMAWWKACRPHFPGNASVYIWGNPEDLWRLWWQGGLSASERLSFRSEIVWDKKSSGAGGNSLIGADGLRQYPPATERCLFFMLGEQAQSSNADEYWDGWEPIRSYLDGERQKMGWDRSDLARITGTTGDMFARWFSKSQWSLPTREHYEAFQRAAGADGFRRDYDGFRRDYDEIRRDYDEIHAQWLTARAPFDNTHDNMTDVWDYSRVTGDDRQGHDTPKPVALCERVHRTSARPGEIVLVPFAGTGPDYLAGHTTGRRAYGIELDPIWCDVICKRFEQATSILPVRDGQPHSFQ